MVDIVFCGPVIDQIRSEVNAALKVIGDKHGFDIKMKSVTYLAHSFKGQLAAQVKGQKTPEAIKYERLRSMNSSFPPLNSWVKSAGTVYQIVGYNTRAPKYPFQMLRQDGARFKFTKSCFDAAVPAEPSDA